MKTTKILAVISSFAMMAGLSTALCASASDFTTGDVDMDGVITGHDTAMVAMAVENSDYALTETQMKLADVDGDGTITMADADALYAKEETHLGNISAVNDDVTEINISDAYVILCYYSAACAGDTASTAKYSEVEKNIMDVDADGAITLDDCCKTLSIYADHSVGLIDKAVDQGYYFA